MPLSETLSSGARSGSWDPLPPIRGSENIDGLESESLRGAGGGFSPLTPVRVTVIRRTPETPGLTQGRGCSCNENTTPRGRPDTTENLPRACQIRSSPGSMKPRNTWRSSARISNQVSSTQTAWRAMNESLSVQEIPCGTSPVDGFGVNSAPVPPIPSGSVPPTPLSGTTWVGPGETAGGTSSAALLNKEAPANPSSRNPTAIPTVTPRKGVDPVIRWSTSPLLPLRSVDRYPRNGRVHTGIHTDLVRIGPEEQPDVGLWEELEVALFDCVQEVGADSGGHVNRLKRQTCPLPTFTHLFVQGPHLSSSPICCNPSV